MEGTRKQHARIAWVCAVALGLLMSAPGGAIGGDVEKLAAEIGQKVQAMGKTRVGVTRFTDLDGKANQQGAFLADEFSLALTDLAQLRVFDRDKIELILKEHKIDQSGLVDPETAARFGQISGIQALVLGTVTPHGNIVRVSVKALDLETAQILATGKVNVLRTEQLESLEEGEGEAELAEGGQAGSTAGPKKPKAAPQSVVQKNFVFESPGCSLSGQTATCQLLISNQGKNRQLTMRDTQTQLFDDAGNGYAPSNGTIANSGWAFYGVRKALLYDTPVRASLVFEGISPQATGIRALYIACEDDESWFSVTFQNLPLLETPVPKIDVSQIDGVAPGGEAGTAVAIPQKGTLLKKFKTMLKEAVTEVTSEAIGSAKKKVVGKVKDEQPEEEDEPSG